MTSPAKPARLTTKFLAGPALRFQTDGRLVALVRDGYESAFEEIFRRYGAALRSYAASIVTAQRADDVTQDAFTKAYLALRGTDKEIQLRPWLYRIVRNTALTNIRDEPSPGSELDGTYAGGIAPEELAEQREEIKRLLAGLRKLPEPQRAAIVMRELEGLSHEQIAASLGLSGGAVRQSIYRARRALREGVGLLLPMSMLRLLLDEGFSQGASVTAAGGGAGIAIKTGIATLLAAGTVTTGAVLQDELNQATPDAAAKATKTSTIAARDRSLTGTAGDDRSGRSGGSGEGAGRHGGDGRGSDDGTSGHGSGDRRSGSDRSGSGSGERSGTDDSHSGSSRSGSGESATFSSSGSGSDDLSSGSSGSGSSELDPGSVDSGSSGSGDPLH